ncbi:hypothetical protein D3C81_1236050 [compost metagenome]
MTAAFFLIVLYTSGSGHAMASVPMATAEECKQAATKAKADLEGTLTKVRTSCVRARP